MSTEKPKLLVFASGSKDGGGSGFKELIDNVRTGILDAEIVGVVSNHANGGVAKIAEENEISFVHFVKSERDPSSKYKGLVKRFSADFVALSGWLLKVSGLDPTTTFNIHPALLSIVDVENNPRFGGKGMYGHHVHEAVIAAYANNKLIRAGVTMHFATSSYDRGPAFFEYPIMIRPGDTAETIAARVNKIEHGWQSAITNMVIHGYIGWNGDPDSPVYVTADYKREGYCPKNCQTV